MNPSESENKPDSQNTAEEGAQEKHEALYDRFTDRVRELFDAGQEKSKEAMEKAMEAARQQISSVEEFSTEQGESFKKFMRRDLSQTALDTQTLGQETKDRLNPSRLGAGAMSSIARLLETAGSALQGLSQKAEDSLRYTTGDITTAGTLSCTKCDQKVHLKRTTRIPPCPSCHSTQFRKGY